MVMTASLPAGKCRELWKQMRETVLWDQCLESRHGWSWVTHFRRGLETLVLSGVGTPCPGLCPHLAAPGWGQREEGGDISVPTAQGETKMM